MKSSIMIAAGAASLAMATPLEKRKMETSWVVEYDTVTVTGAPETAKPTIFWGEKNRPSTTSTSEPVVIVTVTPSAAPAPEPTAAQPSYVVVTETQGVPQQSTTQQPVAAPSPSSSSPPASQAPPTGSTDFISVAVQHHNQHRSNHSAPEVTWSDKLAGYAAITAATCKMQHDMAEGDGGYGQNLANWAQNVNAYQLGDVGALKMAITDFWYNGEFSNFRPEFYGQATPPMGNFESWGHWSQLVWKSSNQIGCASQFCEKGTMYDDMDAWYTVCNYGPQGNVGGQYGTNILKPLGKSIETA
ncbi:PR-1-like protein [Hypoxylon sp. FL1857]|nr:PR-1-like protein [Hypoxylon sp. FL1857]